TYQETGFNYNDASNYTYEIYDTDFEYGTGWYPSSNTAVKVAGTASDLEQDISAAAGKGYRVIHTLAPTADGITIQVGGKDAANKRSASATYTDNVGTTTSTGNLKAQATSTFAGTVDAISCQEITRRATPD
ncbi:MAG: hypothetical protein KKD18_01010, partial [Nanoarchaeota archaeon]|nr:hypothetical protein [Nanoarchaeota archaeon]